MMHNEMALFRQNDELCLFLIREDCKNDHLGRKNDHLGFAPRGSWENVIS